MPAIQERGLLYTSRKQRTINDTLRTRACNESKILARTCHVEYNASSVLLKGARRRNWAVLTTPARKALLRIRRTAETGERIFVWCSVVVNIVSPVKPTVNYQTRSKK